MEGNRSIRALRSISRVEAVRVVLVAAVFFVPCLRAFSERWAAAGQARFPGHADPAFYFSLAKSIASGRGPVIDYVWHFWVPQVDATHFGPDYWMPMPSLVIAGAMKAWGASAVVAARTAVAASLAFSAATWSFARAMRLAPWASLSAAAAAFLALPVAQFSVQADSSLFYSVFVLLSMALGVRSRHSGARWALLLAGVLSGCAQMCRNDGLLVLVSMLIAEFCWRAPDYRRRIGLITVGHVAAVAPYVFMLFRATGRLVPSHGALPFIVDYEDLYRLPPGPSLGELFRMGLWDAVLLRQRASLDRAFDFVRDLLSVPGLVLMLGTGAFAGARAAVRDADESLGRHLCRTSWVLPASYVTALFVLHATITPVASAAGAYSRSLPPVVSMLLVATLLGLKVLRVGPGLSALALGLAVSWPWYQLSKGAPLRVVRENNEVAMRLTAIKRALDQDARCLGVPIVVMTRDPWELTELTGYRSVQIPNGPLDAIVATGRRFGVTHLVHTPRRAALTSPELSANFLPVPGVPGLLRSTAAAHACQ